MRLTAVPNMGAVAPSVTGGVRTHTVTTPGTKGASLSGISAIYYGDPTRWPEIYNANAKGVLRRDGTYGTLTNPVFLTAGDVLHIP